MLERQVYTLMFPDVSRESELQALCTVCLHKQAELALQGASCSRHVFQLFATCKTFISWFNHDMMALNDVHRALCRDLEPASGSVLKGCTMCCQAPLSCFCCYVCKCAQEHPKCPSCMSICTCTRLPRSSLSTTAEAKNVISVVMLQHVHAHVHAKKQHEAQ